VLAISLHKGFNNK